jgi:hypothetical protein
MSRIQFPRKHTVEYLGGSQMRLTCKTCGHVHTKTQMIGPRGSNRPCPPESLARLIKYWQGIEGVTMTCRNCKRLARQAEKRAGK